MKSYSGALKIDYLLIISFLVLVGIGIVTIYSAGTGSIEGGSLENLYIRQIYWALSGIVLFVLVLFLNFHKVSEYAIFIYGAGIFLLLITLLFGKRVRGAKSWITVIGGLGFQPSEFVKIAVIIALARFLERIGEDIHSLKNVILTLAIGLLASFFFPKPAQHKLTGLTYWDIRKSKKENNYKKLRKRPSGPKS